jgi:hypothetical protein
MDFEAQEAAGRELRDLMREYLPLLLDWTAGLVFRSLYLAGGWGWWNSCGPRPFGANAGQLAQGFCRHGLAMPDWMRRNP